MKARSIIDSISKGKLNTQLGEVLARAEQDGYILTIHRGVDRHHSMRGGRRRRGMKVITAPDGRSVFAGYWMDFPEEHWPIGEYDYRKKSDFERARMEANEQLKYGLKTMFDQRDVDLIEGKNDRVYWRDVGEADKVVGSDSTFQIALPNGKTVPIYWMTAERDEALAWLLKRADFWRHDGHLDEEPPTS